jgi:hypothetical protein
MIHNNAPHALCFYTRTVVIRWIIGEYWHAVVQVTNVVAVL